MSHPTQRSGAPPLRERPASEGSSRYDAAEYDDDTALYLDEPELLSAVHRCADRLVRAAHVMHGPLPTLGTSEWFRAPWMAQAATLVILGEAWVMHDPDKITADQLKAVSLAISRGMDWSAAAHHLVYESRGVLTKRRYPPTGNPKLWVRWGPDGPPEKGPAE